MKCQGHQVTSSQLSWAIAPREWESHLNSKQVEQYVACYHVRTTVVWIVYSSGLYDCCTDVSDLGILYVLTQVSPRSGRINDPFHPARFLLGLLECQGHDVTASETIKGNSFWNGGRSLVCAWVWGRRCGIGER